VSSYSAALALEDFVPSILALAAFLVVARMARALDEDAARWALAGGLLVVAGGLSRAAWKFVGATTGADIAPLYLALFPALAFGYPTIATAVLRAARVAAGRRPRVPAALPGALALLVLAPVTVAFATPEGRLVPLLWLVAGTLGSAALSLVLAGWARRAGRPRLALLFVVNLVVTIALNGVARSAQGSESIQWLQQGINTANQLLFLLAIRALAPAVVPSAGHADDRADMAVA
jgi:hypothetical protein